MCVGRDRGAEPVSPTPLGVGVNVAVGDYEANQPLYSASFCLNSKVGNNVNVSQLCVALIEP